MALFGSLGKGMGKSREKMGSSLGSLFSKHKVDEDFWDELMESLIISDVSYATADAVVTDMKKSAKKQGLSNEEAIKAAFKCALVQQFCPAADNPFAHGQGAQPAVVLFVGINGTGKTTSVGKLAKQAVDAGRNVVLGSADTFRAAAIEQLDVWAKRAQVEVVAKERGADPAGVCFATLERGEELGADFVLIDTAGRLHTSPDLMRELQKIVTVTRKRSKLPVHVVLVIDATTGQNGLVQAQEFNKALQLDGLIVTKLDGTAKGGIALSVSHDLNLPIYEIGFGEGLGDIRPFDASEFVEALLGY